MTSDTLSIVMPILNRQQAIVERVDRLLELIDDLSSRIELILVDDGSRDSTTEVLEEMQRIYPQITALRSPTTLGPTKAVEMAMHFANGSFIFLHESYESLDVQSLRKLWSFRHDSQLVVARATTRVKRIDESLLKKLSAWGKKFEEEWQSKTWETPLNQRPLAHASDRELKMIRREALERLARIDNQENALEVSHLSQRRIARTSAASKVHSNR